MGSCRRHSVAVAGMGDGVIIITAQATGNGFYLAVLGLGLWKAVARVVVAVGNCCCDHSANQPGGVPATDLAMAIQSPTSSSRWSGMAILVVYAK